MKTVVGFCVLTVLMAVQGPANSQTASVPPKKSIVQTSCKDYIEMDDVFKPKFIYYTVGYTKRGKPEATDIDIEGVDNIKPVVDEYCRVHLTASAFKKVMEESMASEKAARHKK